MKHAPALPHSTLLLCSALLRVGGGGIQKGV